MGVWSSIRFCQPVIASRKTGRKSRNLRNSNPKQILNLDPDTFSSILLQDVREVRIQESLSENYTGISSPDDQQKTQQYSTNFEYSIGGNLKFYKEHFKQDYLETKLFTPSTLRNTRQPRSVSVSDNDSDPESLRYSNKHQVLSSVGVITEEHGAELSFDNYSTIYEPEFLLNVKSESLFKQLPKEDYQTTQAKDKNSIETEKKTRNNVRTVKSYVAVDDIKDETIFDYDDYSCIKVGKNTKQDKLPEGSDDVLRGNEAVTKRKDIKAAEVKSERKNGVKQSVDHKIPVDRRGKEKNSTSNAIIERTDFVSVNAIGNLVDDFSFHLNDQIIETQDDTNWLGKVETKLNKNDSIKIRMNTTEFYPESPTAEVNFLKTPCSTRHNSLELLTDLDDYDQESSKKNLKRIKDDPPSINVQAQQNYDRLPKEFQEMARRLSKKDESPKARPSLHHVTAMQNFNCSSSTCSTISPRSPSGRTLSRTPSYKMPKTPSLSRQHPATYVTQHTSSRSRPSSRVSSRAPSPTHENCESSSMNDITEYSWSRENGIQHNWISKNKETSSTGKYRHSKFVQNDTVSGSSSRPLHNPRPGNNIHRRMK